MVKPVESKTSILLRGYTREGCVLEGSRFLLRDNNGGFFGERDGLAISSFHSTFYGFEHFRRGVPSLSFPGWDVFCPLVHAPLQLVNKHALHPSSLGPEGFVNHAFERATFAIGISFRSDA